MAICTSCGAELEQDSLFCSSCGTPVSTPDYVQIPDVEVPVSPLAKKYKVFGFIGMGLGILGCANSILGTIYTLMLSFMWFTGFYSALLYAGSCLPFTIAGIAISSMCKKAGNDSRACKIGQYTSLASFLMIALIIVMGVLNLIGSILFMMLGFGKYY